MKLYTRPRYVYIPTYIFIDITPLTHKGICSYHIYILLIYQLISGLHGDLMAVFNEHLLTFFSDPTSSSTPSSHPPIPPFQELLPFFDMFGLISNIYNQNNLKIPALLTYLRTCSSIYLKFSDPTTLLSLLNSSEHLSEAALAFWDVAQIPLTGSGVDREQPLKSEERGHIDWNTGSELALKLFMNLPADKIRDDWRAPTSSHDGVSRADGPSSSSLEEEEEANAAEHDDAEGGKEGDGQGGNDEDSDHMPAHVLMAHIGTLFGTLPVEPQPQLAAQWLHQALLRSPLDQRYAYNLGYSCVKAGLESEALLAFDYLLKLHLKMGPQDDFDIDNKMHVAWAQQWDQ